MAERRQAQTDDTLSRRDAGTGGMARDADAELVEAQNAMAADAAQRATGKPEAKLDETVPGGKYRTADGKLVDANGTPIKD